jgi:hypothetical protein
MAEQITGLGKGGWVSDAPPMTLPMNVFSDTLNTRFDDEAVQTTTGETTSRVVSISPNFGVHWRRPDQGYNIFMKNGNAVRVDAAGGESAMLASANSLYDNSVWQSTLFNGGFAVIVNNSKTTPLYCLYGDPVAGSTFQPLPGWNYVSGLVVTAKVVRSLNYSLVAANLTLTKDGITTSAPSTIRVSVQAATGSIPQTWAPGTTADTADETDLSSTSPILDMLELRGNMFIYSSDSISILSIGQNTRVSPYSKSYGILNTDCAVEFDGSHFVVDRNDIYIHNGSGKIESIADSRIKKYFFNNLNQAAIDKVLVVKNPRFKEIWLCYPKGAATSNTEALVFNYTNSTWTKRTLPNLTYAFNGPANSGSAWQYGKEQVYMTSTATQTLVTNEGYLMWNGSSLASYTSYVEKLKMNTGDVTGSTYVAAIYPVFDKVPASASITVRVSGQNNYVDNADLSVSGSGDFVFLPDSQTSQGYKVDPRVNGRILNYRITSTSNWRMPVFAIDARAADRR